MLRAEYTAYFPRTIRSDGILCSRRLGLDRVSGLHATGAKHTCDGIVRLEHQYSISFGESGKCVG
jgi:hypothetical protein